MWLGAAGWWYFALRLQKRAAHGKYVRGRLFDEDPVAELLSEHGCAGKCSTSHLGYRLSPWERLRLTGGRWRPLLPASPGDPSGDPFGRQTPPAFPLQRIFLDLPCAQLGPLTPTLGQKCGLERLAGGISRYGSKNGPPTVDRTEVAKMKRNP